MNYLNISFSHKNSTIEIREKLSYPDDKSLHGCLTKLNRHESVNEAILISTCNRMEVFCSCNDITADAKTLGKPAMNDYVEGKCTLPYIYLYKLIDESDKEKLLSLHAKSISDEDTLWIQAKMKEHKTVEKSFELAQKLSLEAMNTVKDDKELVAILETMIKRSY